VTVAELTTTVARLFGEERTHASFDGLRGKPHIHLGRMRRRTSAAGGTRALIVRDRRASSRPGPVAAGCGGDVSTQAGVKLLDDASAAILQREFLQTALRARAQGIACVRQECTCLLEQALRDRRNSSDRTWREDAARSRRRSGVGVPQQLEVRRRIRREMDVRLAAKPSNEACVRSSPR